jgi:hypothetical protein
MAASPRPVPISEGRGPIRIMQFGAAQRRQGSFAGAHGNDEVAPIAAVRLTTTSRLKATLSRRVSTNYRCHSSVVGVGVGRRAGAGPPA